MHTNKNAAQPQLTDLPLVRDSATLANNDPTV